MFYSIILLTVVCFMTLNEEFTQRAPPLQPGHYVPGTPNTIII